jgi:hypothetical protein
MSGNFFRKKKILKIAEIYSWRLFFVRIITSGQKISAGLFRLFAQIGRSKATGEITY